MRFCDRKGLAKKSFKNLIWERLGLHLGGFGGALGPLLGALGRLWAVFLVLKVELFLNIAPR